MSFEPAAPLPQPDSAGVSTEVSVGVGAAANAAAAPVSVTGAEINPHARTRAALALNTLLAVLVGALSFLLASTPARNSDLWLHLASGRMLAQGHSPRGTDPFSSTASDVFWVNHSWLSDAALYQLFEFGGGRALLLAKAILAAVLAVSFFLFRLRGSGTGIVVAFAALLAVLALGPWLTLSPVLLSLLGVLLTLYLLERPSLVDGDANQLSRARSLRWLVVPLFALWANLEGWFVLGPVLVGLYALGEALRLVLPGAPSFKAAEFRSLALLTLAGGCACLLTPYHYHTFSFPTPLGLSLAEQALRNELRNDPLGRTLVISPFSPLFMASSVFACPGAWAYYALLAAGGFSFVLSGRSFHPDARSGLRPGRLLAWLALAAMSAYQALTIPFFVVLAAPVLAMNVQEWLLARESRRQEHPFSLLDLRISGALLCACVCLLVLAWPGWLQPKPYQARRWAVEPDESMVRLARQLDALHADGSLRPDRFALTFSPEAAAYLAWFCPAEKGFLDSRWPLFDRVVDDFVRMRSSLLRPDGLQPDGPGLGLPAVMDKHRIDRIILYDPDLGRTSQVYRRLLGNSEWDLLALEGSALLFARRPPAGLPSSPNSPSSSSSPNSPGSPVPWKPYDHRRQAYAPDEDHRAPLVPPVSPPPGPFDSYFRSFFQTRGDRSPDRAEAALHLLYFDLLAESARSELGTQWLAAQATGLLGSATNSCAMGALGTAGTLSFRLGLTPLLSQSAPSETRPSALQQTGNQLYARFYSSHDRGPAAALLLSVRAARRAVAADPNDSGAFLLLGEAYLRLARQTREQGWQSSLPSLASIRRVQALTALNQAVQLRPDLDQAHALLFELCREDRQLDSALDHLRARRDLAETESRKPGAALDRLSTLKAGVESMEKLVQRSLEVYEANAADKDDPSKVYERARLAAGYGLVRKALEMLLESSPVIFGKAGSQLQMELMLRLGRAHEVREWLEPKHEELLGFSAYHWLRAQAVAACGDYAGADDELDQLSFELRGVRVSMDEVLPVRTAMALRVREAVLAQPARGSGPAGLAGAGFLIFRALHPLEGGPVGLLRREADLRVLRGLLSLEAGYTESAREHFRAALEVAGSPPPALGARVAAGGLDFLSRSIAQEMMGLLPQPQK